MRVFSFNAFQHKNPECYTFGPYIPAIPGHVSPDSNYQDLLKSRRRNLTQTIPAMRLPIHLDWEWSGEEHTENADMSPRIPTIKICWRAEEGSLMQKICNYLPDYPEWSIGWVEQREWWHTSNKSQMSGWRAEKEKSNLSKCFLLLAC